MRLERAPTDEGPLPTKHVVMVDLPKVSVGVWVRGETWLSRSYDASLLF